VAASHRQLASLVCELTQRYRGAKINPGVSNYIRGSREPFFGFPEEYMQDCWEVFEYGGSKEKGNRKWFAKSEAVRNNDSFFLGARGKDSYNSI